MPTIEDIQTQVQDVQAKVIELLETAQASVVEYVGKASSAIAEHLPEDRPEALAKGLEAFDGSFAKQVLDLQVEFVKAVRAAAVEPFAPAAPAKPVAKTTKVSQAA
jgi:hypothetical protein